MRYIGEARIACDGDREAAAQHIGRARVELGVLKNLASFNNLPVASRTVPLPDGGLMRLSIIGGLAYIYIFMPEKVTVAGKKKKKKAKLVLCGNTADNFSGFIWSEEEGYKISEITLAPTAVSEDGKVWAEGKLVTLDGFDTPEHALAIPPYLDTLNVLTADGQYMLLASGGGDTGQHRYLAKYDVVADALVAQKPDLYNGGSHMSANGRYIFGPGPAPSEGADFGSWVMTEAPQYRWDTLTGAVQSLPRQHYARSGSDPTYPSTPYTIDTYWPAKFVANDGTLFAEATGTIVVYTRFVGFWLRTYYVISRAARYVGGAWQFIGPDITDYDEVSVQDAQPQLYLVGISADGGAAAGYHEANDITINGYRATAWAWRQDVGTITLGDGGAMYGALVHGISRSGNVVFGELSGEADDRPCTWVWNEETQTYDLRDMYPELGYGRIDVAIEPGG